MKKKEKSTVRFCKNSILSPKLGLYCYRIGNTKTFFIYFDNGGLFLSGGETENFGKFLQFNLG